MGVPGVISDPVDKPLFQLVYESRSNQAFTEEEITRLLDHSREKNRKSGITGILMYRQGVFTQVLEGEESLVRQLFERIAQDPRHREVEIRLAETIQERSFPNWSMGYSRRDLKDLLR